jgi:hypothetical protein
MVKAKWIGKTVAEQKLVVTALTAQEEAALPAWVHDSVLSAGIAVCDGVAYSTDEQTAREKLEF